MKLKVYKGFDYDFLKNIVGTPLFDTDIKLKTDVFSFDEQEYSFGLAEKLYLYFKNKIEKNEFWLTYEEFELIYDELIPHVKKNEVSLEIVNNNIYPELYPINIPKLDGVYDEYLKYLEDTKKDKNETFDVLVNYYSRIEYIDNQFYVSYYNYEVPNNYNIKLVSDYYSTEIEESISDKCDYIVDIGDDTTRFIEHLNYLKEHKCNVVAYKLICNTEISKLILNSLKAYLVNNGFNCLYKYSGEYVVDSSVREDLIEIATKVLKKENFSFRNIPFYKQPELSNEIEEVSQATIMEYIINEAQKAYNGKRYKDIFMTASTGSGKSLIFQIPAIYLAQKFNKLIIIIEPLKGLQLDQQKNLEACGYTKSAYLNSDVATMIEREKIIENVKNGKIDILYVSPETLIAHSIESLIGEREIGLVIVDEAHIVTTWGVGFRPDYWYLGSHLNRMRTKQDKSGKNKKYYPFPIFACTATAVNGGPDDTVRETVVSLYLNDPIIKIGPVKRNNIEFEITNHSDKSFDDYKEEKIQKLAERIYHWIENKEKTIIYCPYSSIAHQMKNGEKDYHKLDVFKDETCVYTGSGEDAFSKSEAMKNFKNGDINVMYATKAFGMGIDISDIRNVYHYAVTGGLNDYIQEIGRAARDENIKGKAIVDYFNGDMKYMNNLFGMSQIKQYHIKKSLSIIYDTYSNKNRRNFLVNPKMFSGVFGNVSDDELTNKIKIVLLMLEKDFFETYKFYVLISRPSSLFTKGYLVISKEYEAKVLNSKFGKYFSKISDGKNRDYSNGVYTTDLGDIFEINLKSIWENEFGSEMSFPEFKYLFFQNPSEILGEFSQCVYNRLKLKIKSKIGNLCDLYSKAISEIDYISDVLNDFGNSYFTKDDFKNKIKNRYLNDSKSEVIANSYFDIVDSKGQCIKKRETKDNITYHLSNGTIRELGKSILRNSKIMGKLKCLETDTFETYYSDKNSELDNDLLKLLSLFDLITFEIEGGNTPEIFIRLNAPDKIKNIVEDKVVYKNRYVELAKDKHYRSVKILDYFFRNFEGADKDKIWDFVERYFLGNDIEGEIIEPNKNNETITNTDKISIHINTNDEKTYCLDDYTDWNDIINQLFKKNPSLEKYIYYCNILNNNNINIPDYAFTEFKVNNIDINSIFIYEKSNLLIVDENFGFNKSEICRKKGWVVIKIDEIESNLELIRKLTNG